MRIYYLQNKSALLLALVILSVLILNSGAFAAASMNPMEQLQQSVGEILKILRSEELKRPERKDERKQLILNVINGMFEYCYFTRRWCQSHFFNHCSSKFLSFIFFTIFVSFSNEIFDCSFLVWCKEYINH